MSNSIAFEENQSLSNSEVQSYERINQTWLSQKPGQVGFFIAAFWVLLTAVATAFQWGSPLSVERSMVFGDKNWFPLFTAIFAHGDLAHFLSNAFLMILLGSFFFSFFGTWKAFVSAVFFGALINLITIHAMPTGVQLLGSSGVVFWIGGAWLVLYMLIDTKRRPSQRLIRSVGVALLLFMPGQAFDPSISYRAHWIGFCLGVLWGFAHYFIHRREILAAEKRELVLESF